MITLSGLNLITSVCIFERVHRYRQVSNSTTSRPEKGAIYHRPCMKKNVEISSPINASEATTIILKRHVAELFGFNTM